MTRRIRILTLALLAGLVIASPAQAENIFAKTAGQALDLLVVRPLGVGRIVVGLVLFIPAAPFAQSPSSDELQSSVRETWDFFVGDQIESTFMTPLGEIEEY